MKALVLTLLLCGSATAMAASPAAKQSGGMATLKNSQFGFAFSYPRTWQVTDQEHRRYQEILATETAVSKEKMKKLLGDERELFSAAIKKQGEVVGRFSIKAHKKNAKKYLDGYLRALKVGLVNVQHAVLARDDKKKVNNRRYHWARIEFRAQGKTVVQEIWITQQGKHALMFSAMGSRASEVLALSRAMETVRFGK
jgi:hypothetical protein